MAFALPPDLPYRYDFMGSPKDDFGYQVIDLLRPSARFWAADEPLPPSFFSEIDLQHAQIFPSPVNSLLHPEPHQNPLSLQKLFSYFLLTEDRESRFNVRKISPLAHQVSLVKHILSSPQLKRVLIADEVGLGKTIEAALLVKELLQENPFLRVLYLAPARLVENVYQEFCKLQLFFRKYTTKADISSRDHCVIASIHRAIHAQNRHLFLQAKPWDILIVDECHHLSDWSEGGGDPTQKYAFVKKIISQMPPHGRLLLLSGTPHQGHPHRFENLLSLLCTEKEELANIRGRVIYRTKEDICDWDGFPLFPKREVRPPIVVELGDAYRAWLEQIYRFYQPHAPSSSPEAHRRVMGWRCFQALQWASSSVYAGLGYTIRQSLRAGWDLSSLILREAISVLRPYRLGSAQESVESVFQRIQKEIQLPEETKEDIEDSHESAWEASPKALAQLLEQGISLIREKATEKKWDAIFSQLALTSPSEKLVLFAHPVETVVAFSNYLYNRSGKRPAIIIGGQSDDERKKQIEHFWDAQGTPFLVSSRAGGEGINLQIARRLVHLDVPWNPMELEQRVGRVHRFGSQKTILVDTIIAKDSPEERMYRTAREKLQLISSTLKEKKDFEGFFSRVMNLIPPQEIQSALLHDFSSYSPSCEHISHLVQEGFKRWESFHQNFSNHAKEIPHLQKGEATREDLKAFFFSGVEKEKPTLLQTSRKTWNPHSEKREEIEQPLSFFQLEDGCFYTLDETYGKPFQDAQGRVIFPLGLNSPFFTKKLRESALSPDASGAAWFQWSPSLAPEIPQPEGAVALLVFLQRTLKADHKEIWLELSSTLHAWLLFDTNQASSLPMIGSLFRKLYQDPPLPSPLTPAPAFYEALCSFSQKKQADLSLTTESDKQRQIRHLCSPLFAALFNAPPEVKTSAFLPLASAPSPLSVTPSSQEISPPQKTQAPPPFKQHPPAQPITPKSEQDMITQKEPNPLHISPEKIISPPNDLFARLHRALAAHPPSLDEARKILEEINPIAQSIQIVPLHELPSSAFFSPPAHHALMKIVPSSGRLFIGLDLAQPSDLLLRALLHALAHLVLQHITPEDRFGHWDTQESILGQGRLRWWDQQIQTHFSAWLPQARQIQALEDCTAAEKASLGLWRMMGEMLGDHRTLHPQAEQYQQAAYQRQGAQRMLAQLEELGGSMLCDGVGLGKTYVATTLIVHYANQWRDALAKASTPLHQNPFRITILAPHSVVRTWQYEAIPPLAAFGVPLSWIRVISHTKLSRITSSSEALKNENNLPSAMNHLFLSDLVLIDEAHNFRSLDARRTKVLRDLLRYQPRRNLRRRVALLTATPINNSLEDLRQQVSLLFSRSIPLSDAVTEEGYQRQAATEVERRCAAARRAPKGRDASSLLVHGDPNAIFSDTIVFRDDLPLGPQIPRIGDYLREQEKLLQKRQIEIRFRPLQEAQPTDGSPPAPPQGRERIAEALLDRIVVQRSRQLCKDIEQQQASRLELLFRPDAPPPEKLYYDDEYDGTQRVLEDFLPLFEREDVEEAQAENPHLAERELQPLSLRIYLWPNVLNGTATAEQPMPVLGLQRILLLKRLESSPVSFLSTVLRLVMLHAFRLQQLLQRCEANRDIERVQTLKQEIEAILSPVSSQNISNLRALVTDHKGKASKTKLLKELADAYKPSIGPADTDDHPPLQLSFHDALSSENEENTTPSEERERLERLWPLRTAVLADFRTLIRTAPKLIKIVFGNFGDIKEWPQRFLEESHKVVWPDSPAWGMRILHDAKLRRLVERLLQARRDGQKVIVFSQFSDTIAYLRSVFDACRSFSSKKWQEVLPHLALPHLQEEELKTLLEETSSITGATEERDDAIDAFAPFYRIGPWKPATQEMDAIEAKDHLERWARSWRAAIEQPTNILFSSDVLAEGVNLQDVALLINFDIHWNPVRMIQRAGRIDRRLNPRIEQSQGFPDLQALCQKEDLPLPRYAWHDHPQRAPILINMLLPDALERELLLRERIATKTLAIDMTLGLEQGTGAEADWMQEYVYTGIASLNAFQKDRAIEQLAGVYERLRLQLQQKGISPDWFAALNGWFAIQENSFAPLLARAIVAPYGQNEPVASRFLTPQGKDGIPHWLWSEFQPHDSLLNFWLPLDGETPPPVSITKDIPWFPDASRPITADDLLLAYLFLEQHAASCLDLTEQDERFYNRIQQGIAAITAGKYSSPEDREELAYTTERFFLFQAPFFSFS